MAPIAKVGRAEAVKECDRAAEVALPVDVSLSMLRTLFHSGTVSFDLAIFAAKVFLLRFLFLVSLLLAVDHATEVGLLAVEALVEGALLHGDIDKVILRLQLHILRESLILRCLDC